MTVHDYAKAGCGTLRLVTDELCTRPATELAALVRSRQVSARELLDAHLDRIERVNPSLNAIITLDAD